MAKKFPWGCVLGGCAATIVVVIVVVSVAGYFGVKKAKELGESMTDPAKRADRVMDVLGAESLPEGLYPGFALSVPFFMDLAFLVDNPPKENGEPGHMESRGLIYFSVRAGGHQQRELERFFEGEANDAELLRQNNIKIDLDRLIGRGIFDGQDSPVRWVSYIGRMKDHSSSAESLITMLKADCDDSRMHLGIWLRPISALPEGLTQSAAEDGGEPEAEAGSEAPAGSTQAATGEPDAFEAEIAEFAGHFRFCVS